MSITEFFDKPFNTVQGQIDAMSQRADSALAQANAAIAGLSGINLENVPEPPTPDLEIEVPDIEAFSGDAPNANLFGGIDGPRTVADPGNGADLIGDITFDDIAIPEFSSSVGEIVIPAPPTPAAPTAPPEAPTLAEITIPSIPDIDLPTLDTLDDINLPEFTFPDLPTFDVVAPTFDTPLPTGDVAYSEPEYLSENLDEVQAQVRRMMAGGTGIPPEVEQAIFARTVERADRSAGAAVDQAFDDFAARGFDMPPGMLNRQVAAAREQQAERRAEANRDIFVQASQWEIENLRFAVQQGLALEQVLVNIWDNATNRTFRMAELKQQAEIALFNAQVGVFNARQQAYATQADVFEKRLNAALSELDVFRAQIEGESAKAQINRAKVDAYEAQVRAVRERVGIFTARMQGAEIQTRAQSNQIDQYRAEVDAYGRQIDADKTRFDAYESQVRGEQAKADIVGSEARAFASTIEGIRSKSNIRVEQIRARLSAVDTATQRFAAKVAAERDFVNANATALSARTGAYQAEVERYRSEVDAERSRHELQQRITQDKLRNNLAFYETQVREYDALMSRLVQQSQVQTEALSAAGRMASQLAAGAMSAMSVGANVSGSASASESASYSYIYDRSDSRG